MKLVSGWRIALRMAWREAWRAKGRSLLVLVMVTFPVVAVVAADITQATASVSSVEGLDRRMGSAEARITTMPGVDQVFQTADPDSGGYGARGGRGPSRAPSLAEVERALGGDRPAIELRNGEVRIRTTLGLLVVGATAVNLHDPLARGLFRLTSGRLPTGAHEVDINAAFAGHGYAVGDTLTESDGTKMTVVGTAESAASRTNPQLVGDTPWLPATSASSQHTWLVGGPPVTWHQVLAANDAGALVLSRHVVEHPPSTAELSPQIRGGFSTEQSTIYAVLALIGVMALIEVVLLAGPAFAVGARRQSRSLALIAANGGTPTQSRRVVLGAAVVIGAFAAVVGVVLGVVVGRVLVPVLQSTSDTYFGPFQIRWQHVVGIAAFGLLSAFLAAVVPAWLASRQDVVAVLAGRRGDRAASRRSPVIGVALVISGVVAAVLGAKQGAGEWLIAVAAILTVFGMIFLVPVVVLGVARLGRGFPLPLRYAVRDAARHRTRTVPAVAAVAATVAGVVALSIGNTSDQAQAKAEYTPQLPIGAGLASDFLAHRSFVPSAVRLLRAAHAAPQVVRGVPSNRRRSPLAAVVGPARGLSVSVSAAFGAEELVADSMPPVLPDVMDSSARAAADSVLARGGVVLFSDRAASLSRATFMVPPATSAKTRSPSRVTVPAYVVDTRGATAPALMVLSTAAADRLSVPGVPVGVVFDARLLTDDELAGLQQAITALSPQGANLYVERGYQVANSEKIVLWILFGLAAVLMLGGTLTATFLALSDARPDLATLSAVGASPGTRRAVAAAYAVSVGVVGAVLGAAVGFVPGIAISYPLTRSFGGPGPTHYLSVPWLEILGLVIALPVLTALVVGLVARSRLPLVARLD